MTLDRIATIRMTRQWPAEVFVTLWLDCDYESRSNKPEVSIEEGASPRRIDFRPLVGLSVAIHAKKYSERLVSLVERVKEHAAFVMVAVEDFGDELGFAWSRLHGERSL